MAYHEIHSFLDGPVPSCSISDSSTLTCSFNSADSDQMDHVNPKGPAVASIVKVACRWSDDQDTGDISLLHESFLNARSECLVLADGVSNGEKEQVCLTPITEHAISQGYGGCFDVDESAAALVLSPDPNSSRKQNLLMLVMAVVLPMMLL